MGMKVSYVGSKQQCLDLLTKFLRGGPDQIKAREHLSLVSLESCTNGRGAHAKASGLRDSFRATDVFGPRICRVICSELGDLVSEPSDPVTVVPLSTPRKKKCVRKRKCVRKKQKRCRLLYSVTMSAQEKLFVLNLGELPC